MIILHVSLVFGYITVCLTYEVILTLFFQDILEYCSWMFKGWHLVWYTPVFFFI